MIRRTLSPLTLCTFCALSATVDAQCPPRTFGTGIANAGAFSVAGIDTRADGDMVVSGLFAWIGTMQVSGLAVWSDDEWIDVPSFVLPTNTQGPSVWMPNGDIVFAGTFTSIEGVAANHIARWNGSNWAPLGSGLDGYVTALQVMPNGDLIVGGSFSTAGGQPAQNIARWDGNGWSSIGDCNSRVQCLDLFPNGDLLVGGAFSAAGGVVANRVAKWDGSAWSGLAFGVGNLGSGGIAYDVLALPGGEAIVTGSFNYIFNGAAAPTPTAGISRWDGSQWSTLGTGLLNPGGLPGVGGGLEQLPNGDVAVSGSFISAGGVASPRLAIWNGSSWYSLGAAPNGSVDIMHRGPNGGLVLGGDFTSLNGYAMPRIAVIASACADITPSTTPGCAGSAGPNVLAASNDPWIGHTFRATATGLTANSLALSIHGFVPVSLPLPLVLPEALPGCVLLTTLDLTTFVPVTAGAAETELLLPNAPTLVGADLQHQVLAAEWTGATITAITSTNALTLTIGAW